MYRHFETIREKIIEQNPKQCMSLAIISYFSHYDEFWKITLNLDSNISFMQNKVYKQKKTVQANTIRSYEHLNNPLCSE